MYNFLRLCLPFKIPDDNDGNGIIVRVINHQYYLHTYSLKFRDPYLEVEFHLACRMQRLKSLGMACVYFICLGIIWVPTSLYFLNKLPTDHTDLLSTDPRDILWITWGVIYSICIVTLCMISNKYTAYISDWCTLFSALVVVWQFIISVLSTNLASFSAAPPGDNVTLNMQAYVISVQGVLFGRQIYFLVSTLLVSIAVTQLLDFQKFLVFLMGMLINHIIVTYNVLKAYTGDHELITAFFTDAKVPFLLINVDYFQELHATLLSLAFLVTSVLILSSIRKRDILLREIFIMKRVRSDIPRAQFNSGVLFESESEKDRVITNINNMKTESPPNQDPDSIEDDQNIQNDTKIPVIAEIDMAHLGESWDKLHLNFTGDMYSKEKSGSTAENTEELKNILQNSGATPELYTKSVASSLNILT